MVGIDNRKDHVQLAAKVLGQVQLCVNGSPVDLGGARQRRLLAALLVHRGATVSTDRLVEATFDGEPPDAAWRTFRTYVARLRRALDAEGVDGSAIVQTFPSGYGISTGLTLDADEFEALLESARTELEFGDPTVALSQAEAALALWSGPAYGDLADEEWTRPDAVRLDELRVVAREVHASAMVDSGRHEEAIAETQAIAALAPLREEPRRLLMIALYRAGRHAEALRAGREFRSYLADQTGLDWSTRLADLEQMIIDRDPRLDAAPRGRKLRGYVLGEVLAQDGHGITYRASQPAIGRDVAITVIPPELSDDASFVRRFERHAQRIASIEHPNVVPLYDYWREPGGAYLVTRYMAGGSLAARLEAHAEMSTDDVTDLTAEVGRALRAAADKGVAHGHLSPDSVLFDEAGRAHLSGFGIEEIDDASARDIVAFADLADVLWRRASTSVRANDHAAVRSMAGVQQVVDRARRSGVDGFASIGDLVEALAAVTRDEDPPEATTPHRPVPAIDGPNPYRGLHAFGEVDADVFFGRRSIVDQIAVDLRRDSFVALIGPSGSGKSSVARAGLLPVLRETGAFVATMVPGVHPVAELEIALSRVATTPLPDLAAVLERPHGLSGVLDAALPDEARLVVLIDQLEEAVTMSDPAERDLVFTALAREVRDRAGRVQIVVTVRADFLGRLLEHPAIGPLVRDHSRLITPLDSDELYDAIVEPAAAAGVAVEPELATALVTDAIDSPGSLPLLQFALTELYEHRVAGTMTLDSYRRMGGLAAPIAQRAEEIYSSLTADEQAAARRLFGRLITLGEGTEDTRRRVLRSELATVPQTVLDVFGAARLLTFDRDPRDREPTVEIAHEALIRRWPRLRSWLDDDRAGLLVLRHLTASAITWDEADRDPSELYRGSRLTTAEEWADEHTDELTPLERAFLDAGRSERDHEADRERRRTRRLRGLTVAFATVAAVALVAGAVAVVQRDRAEANANEAGRQQIVADIERLTAQANATMDEDPDLPILLTLEAYRRGQEIGVEPSADLIAAMQTAVQSSRLIHEFTEIAEIGAIAPDGRTVVGRSTDDIGALIAIDVETREELARFTADGWISDVVFASDGEQLAVLVNPLDDESDGDDVDDSAAATVHVVDVATMDTAAILSAHSCCLMPPSFHSMRAADFSPDDRYLATVLEAPLIEPPATSGTSATLANQPAVLVWDLHEPTEPPIAHEQSLLVGWMPDGTLVTREPFADVVHFSDPTTGQERQPPMRVGNNAGVWAESVELSPDGTRLLESTTDIWSVGAAVPDERIDGLNPGVSISARWSPDGTRIVHFGADDEVRVTDIASGEVVGSLHGHGSVHGVTMSRDGDRLLASGARSTRLWDLSRAGPPELANLPTEGDVQWMRFSADGSSAFAFEVLPSGTRLRLFDLADASELESTGLMSATRSVASDQGLVASSGPTATSTARVEPFDGASLVETEPCQQATAIDDQGRWLMLSRDFDFIQSECGPGPSTLIDPRSGNELEVFWGRGFDGGMFGPSGTIADGLFVGRSFSSNEDGDVVTAIEIRAVPSGELLGSFAGDEREPWAPFFSADGRYVTFGSGETGGYAIDVERVLAGVPMADAIAINPQDDGGVATSPDAGGGWFVMGQSGGELRFYDIETEVEVMTLPVDTGASTTFRITADGRHLYYESAGGVLRRFPLDHGELAALAEQRVQRDFTEAECERFAIRGNCSEYSL